VVAPVAADVQVARRKTLAGEAKPPHQGDGRRVARLDVRLHAVQAERIEGVTHGQAHRLGHQAAPGAPGHAIIPEIGAAERAENDVGNIDHADDARAGDLARDQADIRAGQGPGEPGVEAGVVSERLDPGQMMRAAVLIGADQLRTVGQGATGDCDACIRYVFATI
jgi:hypothetical protein